MHTLPDLAELRALVRRVARAHYDAPMHGITRTTKADGSWVTEVDRQIQDQLHTALKRRWPHYGFIGEEMTHAAQVEVCDGSHAGYWVVDPLDGTTNFTAGFPFYGISLALVVEGRSQLGVVFDPVREECFSAQHGAGAYLNRRRLICPAAHELGGCIAVVDYKRLVGELASRLVRYPPYRSQRNLGASVLEWCWLAAGRVQLYLHGGQKLWDFAAGHLILDEAGGAATSLSGQPLECRSLRKRSVIAAANPTLLSHWQHWIYDNSGVAEPQSSPW